LIILIKHFGWTKANIYPQYLQNQSKTKGLSVEPVSQGLLNYHCGPGICLNKLFVFIIIS